VFSAPRPHLDHLVAENTIRIRPVHNSCRAKLSTVCISHVNQIAHYFREAINSTSCHRARGYHISSQIFADDDLSI
jgi:hypothetical protein